MRPFASRQHGLSLVELMVALTLSLLLVMGMITIFASSRAAFDTTAGVSRTQENSRFALDYIQRDLRMAGHMGCLNEYGHLNTPEQRFFSHFVATGGALTAAPYALRMDLPVEVYDFTGTTPEATSPTAPYVMPNPPALSSGNAAYTPALPTGLALNGLAVQGSDVVVVRYLTEASIVLDGLGVNANLVDVPATSIAAITAARTENNAAYGVTNCKNLSVFMATGNPNGTGAFGAGIASLNLVGWTGREVYGAGARLHQIQAVVYFIGLDTDGSPGLFRKVLRTNGTQAWGVAEMVVPQVDQMQIMVGVDSSNPRDDTVDAYYSPGAVPARATVAQTLATITSLRLSLLMRSPLNGGGLTRQANSGSILLSDVWVRLPADNRMRTPYETLVAIRNRIRN